MKPQLLGWIAALICSITASTGAVVSVATDDVSGLPPIGKIKPRSAHEIVASSWSVGFHRIPIYDSPIIVADKSLLPIDKDLHP